MGPTREVPYEDFLANDPITVEEVVVGVHRLAEVASQHSRAGGEHLPLDQPRVVVPARLLLLAGVEVVVPVVEEAMIHRDHRWRAVVRVERGVGATALRELDRARSGR
jgi:hypothetical protein